MDIPSTGDPKSWFGVVAAALLAVLTWIFRRHVVKQDAHDERLRALENDRVTKGDITAVYERITDLSEQSARQHEMTLRVLAATRKTS